MPEPIKQASAAIVLDDILENLRLSGSIFFVSDLAAPWGMSLSGMSSPRFHIILSGECFVGAQDKKTLRAEEMDIVMLPNGGTHWIADQPGRDLIPSDRASQACELGNPLFQQGKITNRLMCGMVNFDENAKHPILDALPDIINFSMLEPSGPIQSLVRLLDAEMRQGQSASSPIIDRLTEVLFLKLITQYINENEAKAGFVLALQDKRLGKALTMIHTDPGYDWSLTNLGEKAGMSPATLVRQFRESLGLAPMAYINNWRMMKAYNAIKHTSASLEQIAAPLGFKSARTLTRAFTRQYGVTPSKLRHAQQATL